MTLSQHVCRGGRADFQCLLGVTFKLGITSGFEMVNISRLFYQAGLQAIMGFKPMLWGCYEIESDPEVLWRTLVQRGKIWVWVTST